MSERKVLNKYYPADYDPSKIPRAKRPKNRQWTIRTMAPFNMRCNTCGEYIYKGKKFNSRQELADGETFLGLKIFRFYIKCPKCVAEISFKTDPENMDYAIESGATRNFEALRTAEKMAEKEAKEKEDELANNPMKMLENRTKASQREMDMLETLEDLKQVNAKHNKVNTEDMILKYKLYEEKLQQLQDDEDENFIQSIFGKNGDRVVKRLADDDDGNPKSKVLKKDEASTSTTASSSIVTSSSVKNSEKSSANNKTCDSKLFVKKSTSLKTGPSGLNSKQSLSMLVKKKDSTPKLQSSNTLKNNVNKEEKIVETVNSKNSQPNSVLSLVGDYSDSDSQSD